MQKNILIVGNWKMNPGSIAEAKKLFVLIRKTVKKNDTTSVAIAPPFPYISDLSKLSPSGRLALAAQNVAIGETGAETGQVSAPMLTSVGITYTIVGHSECRARGEQNDVILEKVQSLHKFGVTPIVCVGELKRDDSGAFYQEIESQIKAIAENLKKSQLARTVFAYEPVWAIGSGMTPTNEEIQEVRLFIEKVITQTVDRATARKVQVLYGGSVIDKNAGEILKETTMQGFLVGGSSLKPDVFAKIIKSAG